MYSWKLFPPLGAFFSGISQFVLYLSGGTLLERGNNSWTFPLICERDRLFLWMLAFVCAVFVLSCISVFKNWGMFLLSLKKVLWGVFWVGDLITAINP